MPKRPWSLKADVAAGMAAGAGLYVVGVIAFVSLEAAAPPKSKPQITTIEPFDIEDDALGDNNGWINDPFVKNNNGLVPDPLGNRDPTIASAGHDLRPWDSPALKNKDYLKAERDLRKRLFTEPSQFKVPNSLPYKTPTPVVFVLETAGQGSGSDALKAVAGTATQQPVLVSNQVKALLSGPKDNVKIELRDGAEIKTVTSAGLPTWTWDVTNLDGNTTNLTLTISATIKDGDPPVFLKTMQTTIPVHVTMWNWVTINAAPVAQLWGAAVAFGGGIGAVLRFFGKGGKEGKSDNPDRSDTKGAPVDAAASPASD